ncbi:MAG: hypothetical protein IJW18_02940 [Lachnospiraceae bacterium]|nr:hypothetical protein [Lachnospiraceae bacterium]
MAVGSGSIKRVQKAATKIQGDNAPSEVTKVEVAEKKEAEVKEAPVKKETAKKAAPKKTTTKKTESKAAEKKTTAKTKATTKKDDIHEKKFEVVSHISSDLPYYLL